MGVKKKLKLTSLLGLSLLIMTACATNGVTAILQPNRLIFGVNWFTSLRKSFAFYRLILVSEWGLFSLRS